MLTATKIITGRSSVLKPGPARQVDPGLEPVRVEGKTRLEIGPGKPGRPGGTRFTRSNPGETRSIFFLPLPLPLLFLRPPHPGLLHLLPKEQNPS